MQKRVLQICAFSIGEMFRFMENAWTFASSIQIDAHYVTQIINCYSETGKRIETRTK